MSMIIGCLMSYKLNETPVGMRINGSTSLAGSSKYTIYLEVKICALSQSHEKYYKKNSNKIHKLMCLI